VSDPHPLETPEETVSPLPEPKPFDVPGLRITYTHQASSGRTFGFETFVEQQIHPEDLNEILDRVVAAAVRQQAAIELIKAEHDERLVSKRIRLLERDKVELQSKWRLERERSGRRTKLGEDWTPSQQTAIANAERSIEDEKENLEVIRRSIADYRDLMNGHDPDRRIPG